MGLLCTLITISAEYAASLLSGDRTHSQKPLKSCDLDKTWGALHYFVSGSGEISPANPRIEDFMVTGLLLEDISEHFAVHTAAEVAEFARKLASFSTDNLMARFDPIRMNQMKVYPGDWDESGRRFAVQNVEKFRAFILAAAEENLAMLVVIG